MCHLTKLIENQIIMIRKVLIVASCIIIAFTVLINPASADSFWTSLPWFKDVDLTTEQQKMMEKLENKYIPEIESILFPEQREIFESDIQNGSSLRKAFQDMALSFEQKSQLAVALKKIPKHTLFASFTPEQRKEIFLKKKELFMPTPEEIADKIEAGMKAKGTFETGIPESTKEFILEKKKLFMPTPEEIADKIETKMKAQEMLSPDMPVSESKPITEEISERIKSRIEERKQLMPTTTNSPEKVS